MASMRGVLVASALGLAAVTAGCGSSSPTQAQMRAQLQWASKNEAIMSAASGPPGQPWVNQDPLKLTAVQCRQLSAAVAEGLAASPMPVSSLEALWRQYLNDLSVVSTDCLSGHRFDAVGEIRQARITIVQFGHLADSLAAGFHRLPKG